MKEMDPRRMCANCRAFITIDDKTCPYCGIAVGPRAIDRREAANAMAGLVAADRFTTTILLLINTAMFLFTLLRSSGGGGLALDPGGQALVDLGGKFNPYIAQGQWWRLVTAGFLHGGIFHFLMNSWVLWDLAPNVEHAFGTYRFLVIYFVSNFVGFAASMYWTPALSIGASAALSGLIGAMIALGTRERHTLAGAMRGAYIRWVVQILAIGFLFPGIDNAAHVGGLAGGFAVAYAAGIPKHTRADESLWRTLAWIAIAVTAYAFFQMFLWVQRA